MTELFRRRPLLCFYLLAFVMGAGFISIRLIDPGAMAAVFKDMKTAPWHPNIITSFGKVVEKPVLISGILFPLAPTLAAIIVASIAWRGDGLRRLFDRFRPWREGIERTSPGIFCAQRQHRRPRQGMVALVRSVFKARFR